MSNSSSPTPPSPTAPEQKPRGRRWLRILLRVVVVLFILLILLVLLLPTLISTGPGTRFALSFANKNIPGKISVLELNLGWFSGQSISGLDIRDPDGNSVLTAAKIDIPDASLFQLIRGNYNLGTIKLSEPVVTIVQDAKGQLNLARAFTSPAAAAPVAPQPAPAAPAPAPAAATPSRFATASLTLNLENGKITYAAPGAPNVGVNLTSLNVAVPNLQSISLDIDSQIVSDKDTGTLRGKVQLNNFVNNQLQPQLDTGTVDADLSIRDVPVAALDRFAKQEGRLPAILGNVLNASIKAKGSRAQLDATLAVKSGNLAVDVATQLHNSALSKLNAVVQLTNVPLAPVDQMLRQEGKLTALLGTKLTASITATGDLTNMDTAFLARTENLDTNLAAQLRDHKISLPAASPQQTQRIKLTVLPAAVAAFTAQPPATRGAGVSPVTQPAPAKLLAPFDVTVALNALQLQLSKDNQPDLSTLVADLGLALGQINLDAGGDIGTITLNTKPASIGFNRKGEENRAVVNLATTAQYQNNSGDLSLSLLVNDLLDKAGKFNQAGVNGNATVSVANWPMAVVDQIAHTGDVCRNAIGAKLDELKIVANIQPGAAAGTGTKALNGDLTLSLKSQNLNGGLAGAIANDRFTARALAGRTSSGFDWDVEKSLLPALINHFAPGNANLQKLALTTDSARVTLSVDQLVVPLSGTITKGVELKTSITSKDLSLAGVPSLDTAGLKDLLVSLAFSGSGNSADFSTTLSAALPGGASPISLTGHLTGLLDAKGATALGGARGTIAADISNLPPALVDKVMNKDGLGNALLGSPLSISIAQTSLSPAKSGSLPNTDKPLTFTIKSTNLNASIPMTLADGTFSLDPASKVTFVLQPAAVAILTKPVDPAAKASIGLASPATLELDLTRFTTGLQGDAWKKARLAAKLTIDKLATTGDQRLASAGLSQLEIAIPETSLDQTLAVNITHGDLLYGADKGSLSGQVQLSGLTAGAMRYNARLDVEKLPIALADAFNSGDLKLVDLVGPVLDKISLSAAPNDKDPDLLNFSAKVASKALNVDLSGGFKSGSYATVNKSSYAQFDLDPKTFATLKTWLAKPKPTTTPAPATRSSGLMSAVAPAASAPAPDDTVLAKTTSLRFDIDDLSIFFMSPAPSTGSRPASATSQPANSGGGLDPAKSHLTLHLSLPTGIAFHSDSRKEDASISKLTFDLTSTNLADRLDIAAAATTTYQTAGAQPLPGQIKIAGTSLTHLFDSKTGQVDKTNMVVTTDTTLAAIPVGPLDAISGQNGNLLGILGPVIQTIAVKGQYVPAANTSFDLALKATNTTATLPLALSKDMVLTLRTDAQAGPANLQILKITPELAKMLSMAHPLLLNVSGNQKPINLTLDKPSFRVPLQPFSSTDAAVKKNAIKGVTLNTTLDLGTLEMTHGSLTQSLAQLASLLGSGPMSKTFHATFNPLEVHVATGIVKTNDLWLQSYDLYPGKYVGLGVKVQSADLGTDPILGELAVALPGLMVRQIAGTDKYITPEYVFALSKTGPLSSMQLDWSSFVADMGKLTAKIEAANQAQKLAGNNPLLGMAVQTAVNAIADAIPLGTKQSDIRQNWPNLPTSLPTTTQPGQALPLTAPASTIPTTPAPPSTPATPTAPSIPGLPNIPGLPRF